MALVDVDLRPDEKKLKQFGFVALVAFAFLGGSLLWRGGLFGIDFGTSAPLTAYVLFALGGLSAVLSFVMPAANRALYLMLVVVTMPVGLVLSFVIVGALFYGLFTPVGLFFRLIGRDPLNLKFDPAAETYWTRRRTGDVEPARYFRQY
ncbi:MAG: hypothetical protein HRU14_13425 [Planctomycetes bacterium]|nr:hypothetical protein [Planctomycetota bacterium]